MDIYNIESTIRHLKKYNWKYNIELRVGPRSPTGRGPVVR